MTAKVDVSQLTPDDWRGYRELRLAALRLAPYAFGSTLEQEAVTTPAQWRRRLAGRVQYVARLGDDVAGTVGGLSAEDRRAAELVSLWVQPEARGRGVGDALVAAVLDWAARDGYGLVRLWVSEGNGPAERLYARHGFRPTGAVQPIGAGQPERLEFELALAVGRPVRRDRKSHRSTVLRSTYPSDRPGRPQTDHGGRSSGA